MAELEIQKKAVDALVIMNTAIKNLRLYPPSSAMILQTIDRLIRPSWTCLHRKLL